MSSLFLFPERECGRAWSEGSFIGELDDSHLSQAIAETAGVNKPQDLCLTAPPGITGVAFDAGAETVRSMALDVPAVDPSN